MIKSIANPKIKRVRRLSADRRFREKEQAFIAEGSRWLAELIAHKRPLQSLFVTESWLESSENASYLGRLSYKPTIVSRQVMAYASDNQTPPGVLAVVPVSHRPLPTDATLLLILDRVGNPGNLGTILRTAAAAGVDGVLLAPGCVDPYNPKVVRGGMGAQLRLPILIASWPKIAELTLGLSVWLASAGTAVSYHHLDWTKPSALIIGSEASGGGRESEKLAHGMVSIPMYKKTESINAAMAAGIILFEAARQRAGDS